MYCFVSWFLVASTSAIGGLERLVSEMTYYMSSGTLNPTHSLAIFRLPLQRWLITYTAVLHIWQLGRSNGGVAPAVTLDDLDLLL